MTDAEKIKHHDTITEIRKRIAGCFGTADGIFAGHENDEDRAKELRKLALDNKVSLQEIKELAWSYMHERGYHDDHIKEQLQTVNELFGKKLQ